MLDIGIPALVEPIVDNFEDKVCQATISACQIFTLQLASNQLRQIFVSRWPCTIFVGRPAFRYKNRRYKNRKFRLNVYKFRHGSLS